MMRRFHHPLAPIHMLERLGLIYGAYRIALSFFLILLFLLTLHNPLVGGNAPFLYLQTVAIYCFATLLSYIVLRHWPFHLQHQLFVMLIVDVLALSLMLYANGGPSLQMSMLYLVLVVAAHILLPPVRAFTIALLAVITVVWQQFYFAITQQADIRSISGALLLSISFLGVSLLTRHVVKRLQLVEQMAADQAQQMRQLQAINQRIVERMQSGIVVVDDHGIVLLANHAAQVLLHRQIYAGEPLAECCAELNELLKVMQLQSLDYQVFPQDQQGQRQSLGITCSLLERHDLPAVLVLLIEDLERVNQHAQQLKLASLGRLTASIAHEIRNPLAAISQASELLQETIDYQSDRDLLVMIHKQSQRMNRIIEDVLQLSRRQTMLPERLDLLIFLPQLIEEYFPDEPHLTLKMTGSLWVHFDPNQLQQVLINLIENGLHHARKYSAEPWVRLIGGADEYGRVCLDVIDNGAGVNAQALSTLFEPFFTTEVGGTGLGLYLSRAFAEANGARLFHVPTATGACFRLAFALANSHENTL